MNTDDLVAALARGAGPAPRGVALRRLAPVAAGGVVLAAVLAHAVLGWVDLAGIAAALAVKLAYAGALVAAGGWLAARLARPVVRLHGAPWVVAAVVGAMAAGGLVAWADAPADLRRDLLLGHSWATCPWAVLGLSLPVLAGALWAVRGLAPTRPVAAGAACGLFAGAVGAFGYAFSCSETSTTFIALWYSLGIGLATAVGAALGPRCLRW